MGFFTRHPFMVVAAVVAALLVAVIGFETDWGARIRPGMPAPSGKPGAPVDARVLPTAPITVAEQAYPDTVSRPLFVPSRRPAPVAVAAPVATMPKGTLTLQGVTIAGNTRIALLREKSSGRIHRVEVGKQVNGMSLAQVDADRVVLKQGDEQETVVMLVQKAGGATGSAPAPVAPPPGGPFAPVSTPPPPQLLPGAPPTAPGQPPPGGMPNPGARGANPPVAVPSPTEAQPQAAPNAAPMTPEELLARRRARRNQP